MAISTKKSAIASAFLIGALAFTGCGAANDAKDVVSSAVESVKDVPTEGIQTFADDFTKAMTSNTDAESQIEKLVEDSNFVAAMTTITGSDGEDIKAIEESVSKLSDEQKAALKKLSEGDLNKFKDITDYGDLNDDQKITLDFTNFILSSTISEEKTGDLADNKINLDDLSLDGTRVEVPMKAIQELSDNQDDKDFFSKVPAVYTDGTWKLDGEKYYENLNSFVGNNKSSSSAEPSESASSDK